MAERDSLTPGVLVAKIRENQNNNKTLKAQFSTQFLGKLGLDELEGMKTSIQREIDDRQQAVVDEKIAYLQSLGYSISK